MKSWVEISEERLTANYKLLATTAGSETSVLAVVKANGYGHGAELCSPALVRAGAAWLGVTDATEGACVRSALTEASIAPVQQPSILVMSGSLEEEAATILKDDLVPVVAGIQQMEWLLEAARGRLVQPLPVHLEVDTGMARQGVAPGESLNQVLAWLRLHEDIRLDGVMTHFASAEIAGSHQSMEQRSRFESAIAQVSSYGLRPAWLHAGNSSALDNSADGTLHWLRNLAHGLGARAMVRSGLALYGYALPIEAEQNYAGSLESLVRSRLLPVMTWKARVLEIREIEPGQRVGYNGTFIADRSMRLALLPVGYADGLRRELSSTVMQTGGWVMIRGRRAPIVGRVSMNLTIVDVTELPRIEAGEDAVVLGEGITADDHAHIAGTIAYEILCGIRAAQCLR